MQCKLQYDFFVVPICGVRPGTVTVARSLRDSDISIGGKFERFRRHSQAAPGQLAL